MLALIKKVVPGERKVRLERFVTLHSNYDLVGDVVDHLIEEFLSLPGAIDLVNEAYSFELPELPSDEQEE